MADSKEIISLDDYAKQINSIYNELSDLINNFKSRSIEFAYRIGEILSKVKATVPYNKFNEWITSNCIFSLTTANVYHNVYKHYDTIKNCEDLQHARKLITLTNKQNREKIYLEYKELDKQRDQGNRIKKEDNEPYYKHRRRCEDAGDLIKTPDKIVKPRLEGFKSYLDNWYICTSCGGKKIAQGFKRCPYCYKVLKWDDDKKNNLDDYNEDPVM